MIYDDIYDMIRYDMIRYDMIYDMIRYNMIRYDIYMMIYDIFINCNWVVTRWQYTFTHKLYMEQHK